MQQKIYEDAQGKRYKHVAFAFHPDTGVRFVVFRSMDTNDTWCVEASEFHKVRLVDGEPVPLYKLIYEEVDTYAKQTTNQHERTYPGYTNDPRLGSVQNTNPRDYWTNRKRSY